MSSASVELYYHDMFVGTATDHEQRTALACLQDAGRFDSDTRYFVITRLVERLARPPEWVEALIDYVRGGKT